MNAIKNMHEVRFPNIYILSHINNYILPVTIIIALAIKVTYLQCIMVISKVRYDFLFEFFIISD